MKYVIAICCTLAAQTALSDIVHRPPWLRSLMDQTWSCWNHGEDTGVVRVRFNLSPNGIPVENSFTYRGSNETDEEAAQRQFEAVVLEVVRCAGSGYDLDPEDFDRWSEMEMTFDVPSERADGSVADWVLQ